MPDGGGFLGVSGFEDAVAGLFEHQDEKGSNLMFVLNNQHGARRFVGSVGRHGVISAKFEATTRLRRDFLVGGGLLLISALDGGEDWRGRVEAVWVVVSPRTF